MLAERPAMGAPTLECTLVDDTGSISLVFLGRREIAGIGIGRQVSAEGMASEHRGRLALINPVFELIR